MNIHDDGRTALIRCYVGTFAWLAFGFGILILSARFPTVMLRLIVVLGVRVHCLRFVSPPSIV
jgi:hypothetical protein